jgi:hypothetical protein
MKNNNLEKSFSKTFVFVPSCRSLSRALSQDGKKAVKPMLFMAGCILFFLSSCRKDEKIPDAGYSYFPDNVGHWCIYDVDSTVYDEFHHDTVYYHYQVKEVIQSYFTDNSGRQAMRIERYKRMYNDTVPFDSLPWTISRVWSFVRTSSEGEKVEENQRFIRLTFVPRKGIKWDGNAYNTIGEWKYKYTSVDEPYSVNNMHFDSTLNVQQKLDTNMLDYRIYSEHYARHVGLIEKDVIDVHDDVLSTASVLTRIEGGTIYHIKLVSWGN